MAARNGSQKARREALLAERLKAIHCLLTLSAQLLYAFFGLSADRQVENVGGDSFRVAERLLSKRSPSLNPVRASADRPIDFVHSPKGAQDTAQNLDPVPQRHNLVLCLHDMDSRSGLRSMLPERLSLSADLGLRDRVATGAGWRRVGAWDSAVAHVLGPLRS